MTSNSVVRVAVTQAEPGWFDLAGSVKKTCDLITEAAANGAELIVFPECWIPGYPCWIWTRLVDSDLGVKYIKNSLVVDSIEMETIRECAAQNKIIVSLGFSDNDGNSLYIAQCTISSDGQIQMKRRKIKPTHMERTIFGDGSGSSLLNVVSTNIGKIGALSCWEHIQPLLKYHTISQGEEIHVAAWPPLSPHNGGPSFWSISAEGCQNLSQTYAIESQTFVLHSTSVITKQGVDANGTSTGNMMSTPGGGMSAVFGPDGRKLSEPLDAAEEGIVYADLDMNEIIKCKTFADPVGHYSRPDLLWLGVDTKEKKKVYSQRDAGTPETTTPGVVNE
ncbi:carbon-nitrogen hydrolase [Stipitochalara longipes BDJ]|nr:carbon-nitrogen hydrolase [Stipitochalara longipes BDJ]